jgi:biopolymer transport protein ExbD
VIGSKTYQLGTFNKHFVSASNRKKKTKRVIVAGLMLTSMVDMFSLLVIFLLQSFSNSPQVTINKGVALPVAISGSMTTDAPVISISADDIMLDNKMIGSTITLLKTPQPLITELQNIKNIWVKSHQKEAFSGEIHLQADKGLSAPLVSEVMSMLISQGYSSIQLAVVSGGAK